MDNKWKGRAYWQLDEARKMLEQDDCVAIGIFVVTELPGGDGYDACCREMAASAEKVTIKKLRQIIANTAQEPVEIQPMLPT